MKRIVVAGMVLVLVGLSLDVRAAGLSRGDKVKLKRWAAVALDPATQEKQESRMQDAWNNFTDWFHGRRAKMMADVGDISEVLAAAAVRPNQQSGVRMREFDMPKSGDVPACKMPYLVSVPRTYSGSLSADPTPLIIVLPDRGQKLEDCLDTCYPASTGVRQNYIIAVLGLDYHDYEIEKDVQEKNSQGYFELKRKKVKVPFTWASKEKAFDPFWKNLYNLMMKEYKVDPNRVILDGAGFGSKGAMNFAAGQTWRFGGFVDRGNDPDRADLQNLRYLKVLYVPGKGKDAPSATLKKAVGSSLTVAGTGPGWVGKPGEGLRSGRPGPNGAKLRKWLGTCRRARYPLPSKWVAPESWEDFGYWFFVEKRIEDNKPVIVSLKSDRKKNVVELETENAAKILLWLNDEIVDLGKPFKIVVNGKELAPTSAERSADMLLRHACASRLGRIPYDPGSVFTAEVDVTVPTSLGALPGKGKDGNKAAGKKGKEQGKAAENKGKDEGKAKTAGKEGNK